MKGKILVLLSVIVTSFGCSNTDSDKDASSEASITEGTPFSLVKNKTPELVIAHKVDDYELWKASFDWWPRYPR